ncbi:hypothetical protein A2999_00840 [Candidatus Wolfebacteria bacterium RIFCSPLOWO2_01_FULL_38_11]|uniref:PpiC-type peptidyl-prolyl cis-trans isomerase n=2 Tax=Candidatus Wolfeibacteriota TaxID=1752735 RepID=A0A0G0J1Z1_9BACT|nr:MAG: hypothetical protein US36_C0009G0017 [Candidatus Wolfebacteria bacterium GW2011_GWC1_37_10]OGM90469.1 MAG: hypothetical protein A2999_00840 [Candidatus Wolfebacteria bacterium RIFCSPLOWO2_01_FULL_38_11]
MKKIWFLILVLIGISVFGSWVILTESYPVVLVNFKIIGAGDFSRNYASSLFYYKNAAKVYGKENSDLFDAEEVRQEIKRALISSLIENVLINEELNKEINSLDLEKMIDEKIEKAVGEKEINRAAESIYGLSYDNFKTQMLIPQAKKEILEEKTALKGENFEEKMEELKSKAKVMIFLSGFEWDGKEVIIK